MKNISLLISDWDGTIDDILKDDKLKSYFELAVRKEKDQGRELFLVINTGRPVNYSPANLESINSIPGNPALYAFSECGSIKEVPVNMEAKHNIFGELGQEICSVVKDNVNKLVAEFIKQNSNISVSTDVSRINSSIVKISSNGITLNDQTKNLVTTLKNDKYISKYADVYLNPDGGIAIEPKILNKSNAIGYTLIDLMKKDYVINNLAYSGDGTNDLKASEWTLELKRILDHTLSSGNNNFKLIEGHFSNFLKYSSHMTNADELKRLIDRNLSNGGFKNIDVVVPANASNKLKELSLSYNNNFTIANQENALGILPNVFKKWNLNMPTITTSKRGIDKLKAIVFKLKGVEHDFLSFIKFKDLSKKLYEMVDMYDLERNQIQKLIHRYELKDLNNLIPRPRRTIELPKVDKNVNLERKRALRQPVL